MAGDMTDDRLETVLISVGHHLVVPPEPREAARDEGRSRLVLLGAAAAVLVAVAAALVIPPARTAIADLLGIGSTELEVDPGSGAGTEPLPTVVGGLDPISGAEASGILGGPLPDTTATALGAPGAIYGPPEGGVLLAWAEGSATLWVRPDENGPGLFTKLLGGAENVERIAGVGDDALYIGGPHVLETPHRRLAAESVLLWLDDGIEYRLEADLSQAELVEIGRAVR